MTRPSEIRRARCHCGAVVIEAELPQGLASATPKILQGADKLALYSFGTPAVRRFR